MGNLQRERLLHHGTHGIDSETPITVAIDHEGHPHLGWCGKEGLFHQTFDGTTWTTHHVTPDPVAQVVFAAHGTKIYGLFDRGAVLPNFSYPTSALVCGVYDGEAWDYSVVVENAWRHGSHGPHFHFDLAITPTGTVGVVWRTTDTVLFAVRADDGSWDSRALVTDAGFLRQVRITADPHGVFHILFASEQRAHYASGRTPADVTMEVLTERYDDHHLAIVATADQIHVAYMGDAGQQCRAFYRSRTDGSWSDPLMLRRSLNNGYGNHIAVDAAGEAMVLFREHKSHRNQSMSGTKPCTLWLARPAAGKAKLEELGETGFASALAVRDGVVWAAFADTIRGGLAVAHPGAPTLKTPLPAPDIRFPVEVYEDELKAHFEAHGALHLLHDKGKKYAKLHYDGTVLLVEKGTVGKEDKAKVKSVKVKSPEKAVAKAANLATFDFDDYAPEGVKRPW